MTYFLGLYKNKNATLINNVKKGFLKMSGILTKDLCPPCIYDSAKSLYIKTRAGKPDAGRTHIKMAYHLYRMFGGTDEKNNEFIDLYTNWSLKSIVAAKYFYGNSDNQSLTLHHNHLKKNYEKRKESINKPDTRDTCVKLIRSFGSPSDMCAICPYSSEYMNARIDYEKTVLGYALLNRDITFLDTVKLNSMADFSSIVYEDIALHFTGSYLLKSKDKAVYIGGNYNFHALIAYFFLIHRNEFKENTSALMEDIFSRSHKGVGAVADILLHELYTVMCKELIPGCMNGFKRYNDKNYSINISEVDFKASFISALKNIISSGQQATHENYIEACQNLSNIYTYTDYPKFNENTGRGSNYNKKRMTDSSKKTPDKKITSGTAKEEITPTTSLFSMMFADSPLLQNNTHFVSQNECNLGEIDDTFLPDTHKTKENDIISAAATPDTPVINEKSLSLINTENSIGIDSINNNTEAKSLKTDLKSVDNNKKTDTAKQLSAANTANIEDSTDIIDKSQYDNISDINDEKSINTYDNIVNSDIINTDNNHYEHDDKENNITLDEKSPASTSNNGIKEPSIIDVQEERLFNEVMSDNDYMHENIYEENCDFYYEPIPEENDIDDGSMQAAENSTDINNTNTSVTAANESANVVNTNENIEESETQTSNNTDNIQQNIDETPVLLEDLHKTSITDCGFINRINTLYDMSEEDATKQACIWIEKLCIDEDPLAVTYAYYKELDRYGLLFYSPIYKEYYFISDDMGKNFNDVCWHIFMGEGPRITLNYAGVNSYLLNHSLRARNLISLISMYAALQPDCTEYIISNIILHKVSFSQTQNIYEQCMPYYMDAYRTYSNLIKKHDDDIKFMKALKAYKNYDKIAGYAYFLSDITSINGPGVENICPGKFKFFYTNECLLTDCGYSAVTLSININDFNYGFTTDDFFLEMLLRMIKISCFSKFRLRLAKYDNTGIIFICPTDIIAIASDAIVDSAGRTYKKLCKNSVIPEFTIGCLTH